MSNCSEKSERYLVKLAKRKDQLSADNRIEPIIHHALDMPLARGHTEAMKGGDKDPQRAVP